MSFKQNIGASSVIYFSLNPFYGLLKKQNALTTRIKHMLCSVMIHTLLQNAVYLIYMNYSNVQRNVVMSWKPTKSLHHYLSWTVHVSIRL